MEVILLQKVANLGNIGDRVKVRSGFGRNFLLPQGKATLATPENVARFEARRVNVEPARCRTGRFHELYAAWRCERTQAPISRSASERAKP